MRFALLLLLLAPDAAAQQPEERQQILLSGVVKPLPGPTICMTGNYYLDASPVLLLEAPGVDLAQWVGQVVTITGEERTSLCPDAIVVEAQQVAPSNVQLFVSGSSSIGGTLTFEIWITTPNYPHNWILFYGDETAFLPRGGAGTLLIAPPLTMLASGHGAAPLETWSLGIPNAPHLIGRRYLAQVLGQTWPTFIQELSNPVLVTIQP